MVSTVFNAGLGSAPTADLTWQFLSPTVEVTVASGQHLAVWASQSLHTAAAGSGGGHFEICHQQGAGAVTKFGSFDQKLDFALNSVGAVDKFTYQAPAAGTYTVGLCGSVDSAAFFTSPEGGRVMASVYQ